MKDHLLSAALRTPATLHLAACDPDWATLIQLVGPCGLPADSVREPFEALVRAITYQQLHGKAAESILNRFLARFPDTAFPDARQILALPETEMRSCGLSASKIIAIRDLADKSLAGIVPTRMEALLLDDEVLIERLTSIRGVGRWTVEMLLIFTLLRPDVWPIDDFGVREGWRAIKGLPAQFKPREMLALGEAWRPYRSTAAWYLWRAADLWKVHQRTQKQAS